jgi:hypothetical protein
MLPRILQGLVIPSLGLMVFGCGQSPPTPIARPVNSASAVARPTQELDSTSNKNAAGILEDLPVVKATSLTESRPKVAVPVNSQTFSEAAFLGDDVVGLVVGHPKRVTDWPIYPLIQDAGLLPDFESMFPAGHLKLESIERVTLVIDETFMNTAAKELGLEASDDAEPTPATVQAQHKRQLQQLATAFHNYYGDYQRFPRADGDGAGQQTGLSWRVHLLPYIQEADLYQQFHLDEPWDSDHNKTLIENMPVFFQLLGDTNEGKTSMHVFTGQDTPFDGLQGKTVIDISDEMSDTILVVLAGVDTADVWTKPGGLKFDPATCKKSLGEINDKTFLAVMTDGSVQSIPLDIEESMLANLIQLNDGHSVEFARSVEDSPTVPLIPTVILTLASAADRSEIVTSLLPEAVEETHAGQTLFKNETAAVFFADGKTIVFGPVGTVRKMIGTKLSERAGTRKILSQLQLGADVTAAFDLESQASLLQKAVEINPVLGLALQLKSLSLQATVTGVTDDTLFELVATTVDEQSAAFMTQLAAGALRQGQEGLSRFPIPDDTDADKATKKLIETVVNSADIKQNSDRIEFLIPVPEDFDKLPELLKPAMLKARAGTEARKKRNNLNRIFLAFLNYDRVHSTLPGAGRSADGKSGLSWRVHLLPYLNEVALYKQFNFDEAWDSDQNRVLIEKMPALFKVDGVSTVGKTSFHVFTGAGSPFADDQTPRFATFTDGPQSTILVVQAGPDTADIWTKPGGLDFDPKNPRQALGTLSQDHFLVLMGGGAVHRLNLTIPAETFRDLIEHQDGHDVGDYLDDLETRQNFSDDRIPD